MLLITSTLIVDVMLKICNDTDIKTSSLHHQTVILFRCHVMFYSDLFTYLFTFRFMHDILFYIHTHKKKKEKENVQLLYFIQKDKLHFT